MGVVPLGIASVLIVVSARGQKCPSQDLSWSWGCSLWMAFLWDCCHILQTAELCRLKLWFGKLEWVLITVSGCPGPCATNIKGTVGLCSVMYKLMSSSTFPFVVSVQVQNCSFQTWAQKLTYVCAMIQFHWLVARMRLESTRHYSWQTSLLTTQHSMTSLQGTWWWHIIVAHL